MKYSEYLELVKTQLQAEKFICYAAEKVLERSGDNDNLQEHDENYVLGRPVGRSEKISARVSPLNGHIAYHKARGN